MPTVVRLAACAAAMALFALGETVPDKHLNPSVAVFVNFELPPGASSVQVMKKEAEDLLKPAGITLDWKMLTENDGREAYPGVVMLTFKGRCRAEYGLEPEAEPGETTTLGTTRVVDGHVLPFSEVECDQVRKALSYLSPETDRLERQRALGLAMGRVVAHELYHILARTTGHAKSGLAQAQQSLLELVGEGRLKFGERDTKAMGEGLRSGVSGFLPQ